MMIAHCMQAVKEWANSLHEAGWEVPAAMLSKGFVMVSVAVHDVLPPLLCCF